MSIIIQIPCANLDDAQRMIDIIRNNFVSTASPPTESATTTDFEIQVSVPEPKNPMASKYRDVDPMELVAYGWKVFPPSERKSRGNSRWTGIRLQNPNDYHQHTIYDVRKLAPDVVAKLTALAQHGNSHTFRARDDSAPAGVPVQRKPLLCKQCKGEIGTIPCNRHARSIRAQLEMQHTIATGHDQYLEGLPR